MNKLEELFDLWDKDTGDGRDAAGARAVCTDHVSANPTDFAELEAHHDELVAAGADLTDDIIPEFVKLIDQRRQAALIFREHGMEDEARACDDDKLRIDTWIMHKFDPQEIGGTYTASVRLPNNG